MRSVYVITGVQAAGKSTVAQRLAERLDGPAAHVHGDLFRRWIVNGRVDMGPAGSAEAEHQLRLRHRLAAQACNTYAEAGVTPVVQDVFLGEFLNYTLAAIRARPLHLVVLAPRPDAVAARESGRGKVAYDRWTVDALDRILRDETPRIGLWLDTSELTVEETVDRILAGQAESEIDG
ncbi:phosphotransferase-like protein [Pseudonocardia sp. TRM90224]|uniref:phosphotransferase-like protein n=1 Tax=Pseudonocardia sp. TRM90224 TaxID=2812678 RepID=UPI001E29F380|nr:phosphotransferase [Pseudonocardia sp. TRM90224]